MNHELLDDKTIHLLTESGWDKDRDFSDKLVIHEKKLTFDVFFYVSKSLCGLIYHYDRLNEEKCVYFDSDESINSKNIRANSFGFESHEDAEWKLNTEYRETEDFDKSDEVRRKIGVKSTRIGFWYDDDLGYDLYVDEQGKLYIAHSNEPQVFSNSIEGFLNKITGLQ